MSTITPTLTQLEYALAIAQHGSFRAAARACHVSQPALSAQVAKLEEGLGAVLFDRKTRPVIPTDKGRLLLPRFETIVAAVREVEELASAQDDGLRGELRLGIIPTLAPYLLPRFLPQLCAEYPAVHVVVRELTTEQIVDALRADQLDAGVLATPLQIPGIHEARLFDEPLRIYASPMSSLPADGRGRRLTVEQLPTRELIVMTEGHCLRTQVLDLCELGEDAQDVGFQLETGSMSTLVRMLDKGPWFTVLPELALDELDERARRERVFEFAGPRPYREVGLVFRRRTYRAGLREVVAAAIVESVPLKWRRRSGRGRRVAPV
ncbi:MAG: LysR substrate-binding domain-containing protein [Nannocystaceae bacterium]